MSGPAGLGTAALTLFAALGMGPATADGSSAQSIVDEIAATLRAEAMLPGLSVAIANRDTVIYTGVFGFADLATEDPVTPTTRFRAASVSKAMTATAVGRLVQNGTLDLDARIGDLVKAYPKKAWPITVRQLAGHLGGVPHYSEEDRLREGHFDTVTDALAVFSHEPLMFEPGSRYYYSSHGYVLLSAALEAASGLPYLELMRQVVYAPLGMTHSGPETGPQGRANGAEATLYTAGEDGAPAELGTVEDPSYKWAAGGLISSPTDLARMGQGYFNGFISPEIADTLFQSQRVNSGDPTAVGIGWRGNWDLLGNRVFEHAGSMDGARAVLCIFPERALAIAVMTNRDWSSVIEETAHVLAGPWLLESAPPGVPNIAADGDVILINVRGEASEHEGRLVVDGDRGRLEIDRGTADAHSLPLRYLGGQGLYALIRPDGVFYCRIRAGGGEITADAYGYGSPRLTPPSQSEPFIQFSSHHVE